MTRKGCSLGISLVDLFHSNSRQQVVGQYVNDLGSLIDIYDGLWVYQAYSQAEAEASGRPGIWISPPSEGSRGLVLFEYYNHGLNGMAPDWRLCFQDGYIRGRELGQIVWGAQEVVESGGNPGEGGVEYAGVFSHMGESGQSDESVQPGGSSYLGGNNFGASGQSGDGNSDESDQSDEGNAGASVHSGEVNPGGSGQSGEGNSGGSG